MMPVYVDDMAAPYGRMKMFHMVADTTEELLEMADRIGVARRWLQHAGTPKEHFDIGKGKRAIAVRSGAIEVTMREMAQMVQRKRAQAESPVLKRLTEEVRNESEGGCRVWYNRMHNRHNRS